MTEIIKLIDVCNLVNDDLDIRPSVPKTFMSFS